MFSLLLRHPAYASLPERRRFLRHVSAGCLGAGLPELLTLQGLAAQSPGGPRAKQVLVVYEEGASARLGK